MIETLACITLAAGVVEALFLSRKRVRERLFAPASRPAKLALEFIEIAMVLSATLYLIGCPILIGKAPILLWLGAIFMTFSATRGAYLFFTEPGIAQRKQG